MCFLVNKDLRRREAAAPSKARAADFLGDFEPPNANF
jgi:hypothetical protein